MRAVHRIVIAAAILLWSTELLAAPPKWQRLQWGRWEIVFNTNEKAAAETLSQLEEMRQVFGQSVIPLAATAPPVRVVLFRGEQDYAPFRPARDTGAFYQSGPERDFIVLSGTSEETLRAARHEFVHMVLNHAMGPLPRWLEEGLAEFFSTLQAGGGKVRIGRPIPARLQHLERETWLGAAEFFSVKKGAPELEADGRSPLYYAQCWALVHMLQQVPVYRGKMARFLDALAAGNEEAAAFERSFGVPREKALAEMRDYVSPPRFAVSETPVSLTRGAPGKAGALPTWEPDLILAELFVATGHAERAAPLYERAAKAAPDSSEAASGLGLAALRGGNNEEAARQFQRAVQLGATDATAYFELAMMTRERHGDRAEVERLLRAAIERNPNHAEAHYLLGRMFVEQKRVDEALPLLDRATKILPRQPAFWCELALAYHAQSRRESARRAALEAVRAAVTEQDSEMARGTLRTVDQPVVPLPAARLPESTQLEGWAPKKGDATVSGKFILLDCAGTRLRFTVLAGKRRVALFTEKPNEVMMRGGGPAQREFVCGPQKKPADVMMEYIAKPDAKLKIAGEVVAIEFH